MNQNLQKKNLDGERIKTNKKDFIKMRDRLSKPKIKAIRKDLYRIEKKGLKNFLKLGKSLSKMKKYDDYDNIEYKGIRDIQYLLNL